MTNMVERRQRDCRYKEAASPYHENCDAMKAAPKYRLSSASFAGSCGSTNTIIGAIFSTLNLQRQHRIVFKNDQNYNKFKL